MRRNPVQRNVIQKYKYVGFKLMLRGSKLRRSKRNRNISTIQSQPSTGKIKQGPHLSYKQESCDGTANGTDSAANRTVWHH